eukprot:257937-Chlamydomonas_euryale.AAC.3
MCRVPSRTLAGEDHLLAGRAGASVSSNSRSSRYSAAPLDDSFACTWDGPGGAGAGVKSANLCVLS